MIVIRIVIAFIYCVTSDAVDTIVTFRKQPHTSISDGLTCAIKKHETARGVKFNTQTKVCVPLSEAWFRSQVYEEGQAYFKLLKSEIPFPPTYNRLQWLPATFVVGSTVTLYVQVKRLNIKASLYIFIKKDAGNVYRPVFLRILGKRGKTDTLTINSDMNGRYGREVVKVSPFRRVGHLYKVDLIMFSTFVQIRVDGIWIHNLRHRAPISFYNVIEFTSSWNFIICKRIQFANNVN